MSEKKMSTVEWRELTPEEWARIAPLIGDPKDPSRLQITNQQVVNAAVYINNTKTPWKKLPEEFGPWTGVAKRVSRWRKRGIYQQVYDELEKMGLITVTIEPESEPPIQEDDAPTEWWELTTEEWDAISYLFPTEPREKYGNSRYKTYRQMINALLYREYMKKPWREIPEKYGHWRTVNDHFAKWRDDGTLEKVFKKLKELGVLSEEKYSQGREALWGEETPSAWWELTDEQWKQIKPLLPPENHQKGSQPRSNRQMLNAILCRHRTKKPWRELPKKYGHWRTVNNHFTKWRDDGTLQRIFDELDRMDCL